MNYTITGFDGANGVAQVRFFDGELEAVFSIDIPISGGAYLTGGDLDAHIRRYSPDLHFDRIRGASLADPSPIESLVITAPKTPEQIKTEALQAIDKIKINKLAGGFTFNGMSYPCDGVFQQQITAFVTAFREGIIPPGTTITIRTYDDQLVQLGEAEIKALAAALLVYVQSVYAESWAAKDALV